MTEEKKVLMMLGGMAFEPGKTCYDDLSKSFRYKWNSYELSGAKPKRNFDYEEDLAIKLNGKISTIDAGLKSLNEIKKKAGKGEPLMMVDGMGNVHGLYTIESIDEKENTFLPGGVPRFIEFSMEIKKYDQ